MGIIKITEPDNIESYNCYLNHPVYIVEKFKQTKRIRYLGYHCKRDNGFYLDGFYDCFINLPDNKQRSNVIKAKIDCKRFTKHLSDEEYLFSVSHDFKLGITGLPIEAVTEDTPVGWYIDINV